MILPALWIAWCYACAGRWMTGKPASSLAETNYLFLSGMAASGLVLYPLSVVLQANALNAVLLLLSASGVAGTVWHRPIQLKQPWFQLPAASPALALVALATIQFIIQNSTFTYLWDGYQIWATKALVLFHDGALSQSWVAGEHRRIAAYPHIVPLYEALTARLSGTFEWNSLKPVFLFFYLSMLISTFHAARQLVSKEIAWAIAALVALLPAVSTRTSVGGYADMPQAAFVIGAVGAFLSDSKPLQRWKSTTPWIIGGITLIKSEGLILAAIFLVVCMPWRAFRARPALGSIGVMATFALFRIAFLRWLHIEDSTYGPIDRAHIERAFGAFTQVPISCVREMLTFDEWGGFWIAFIPACIVVLFMGTPRERALVGGHATRNFRICVDLLFHQLGYPVSHQSGIYPTAGSYHAACRAGAGRRLRQIARESARFQPTGATRSVVSSKVRHLSSHVSASAIFLRPLRASALSSFRACSILATNSAGDAAK